MQTAMVETILAARHYVYIENQFFISYVKGGSPVDLQVLRHNILK